MATAVAGMVTPHCRCRSANNSGSGGRSRRLLRLSCFSADSSQQPITKAVPQYKPGFLDNLFLHSFRSKMAKETRWDSDKPGYDGLIEVANRLMIGRSKSEAQQASIRILRSLFPPFLLKLYSILISPLAGGQLAAVMVGKLDCKSCLQLLFSLSSSPFGISLYGMSLMFNLVLSFFTIFFVGVIVVNSQMLSCAFVFTEARVTALSCKWLMGPCEVNAVTLPDGTSWTSGVFVERCKYLEESKCVGICVNTCKLPTQIFFKDYMGVPLVMEPNFNDYSCQFKFGVLPLAPEAESTLKESCLETCPYACRRRESGNVNEKPQSTCPML